MQHNIWVKAVFQTKLSLRSAAHSYPPTNTISRGLLPKLWLNTSRENKIHPMAEKKKKKSFWHSVESEEASTGGIWAIFIRSDSIHIYIKKKNKEMMSFQIRKNSLCIMLGSVRDRLHTKEAKKTVRSFSKWSTFESVRASIDFNI